MIELEHAATNVGDRDCNLDRYGHFSAATWSLSYMLDGFREVEDHFVIALEDALKAGVRELGLAVDYNALCALIAKTITQAGVADGGASAAFYLEAENGAGCLRAGDTRIYWLDRLQKTVDHSRAQDYIDAGKSPPESLPLHPYRNYLTRSISSRNGYDRLVVKPCNPLEEGERLLLCTDGFWRALQDENIFTCNTPARLKAMYAQVTATCSMKRDNCSVILLRKGRSA